MNNKHAVVKSFVLRDFRTDKMCKPIIFIASLVKSLFGASALKNMD